MAKMCFSLVFTLLVGQSLVGASPAPLDGESLYDTSYKLQMPASCAGQNYCFDKDDHYPDEKIDELVYDMRDLVVDYPNLKNRFGDDSYDEPDCASNSTENPIYYIVDTDDRVRVVVQSPKKFQQIYSIKWCLDEGKITKDTPHFLKSTTLQKYSMECVSTRMNFNFFVLSDKVDPKTLKPMMESAMVKGGIPVCCRCRYNAN
ncbi:hypothetical protein PYW07_001486 [Mythimna separata]|uniref:Spaetzle domain-containing protein n=1 Tax=Mythimna separata TaxID=271217 RepID=A0AAD8DVZ4_MYTSE|nr:hypothetical protein PYW07_001486 [Mythimna separata]